MPANNRPSCLSARSPLRNCSYERAHRIKIERFSPFSAVKNAKFN